MKFDDCRCKGKAVMCQKPIFSYHCIVTLSFDILTPTSIGHILDSCGVFVLSSIMIGVKGKQLTIFSNQCIVTLTFDLLTPRLTGPILDSSVPVNFHEDWCKVEAVMHIMS